MRMFMLCVLLFGCASEEETPTTTENINEKLSFCHGSGIGCYTDNECAKTDVCRISNRCWSKSGNCFQNVKHSGLQCRKDNCETDGLCSKIDDWCIAGSQSDCDKLSETIGVCFKHYDESWCLLSPADWSKETGCVFK